MLGTTWKTICHAHWPGCAGVCTGWWAWRTSWCSDCRQRSSLLRCSLPSPSPSTPPHLHEENGTTQTTVFIALMARNDCHATDFSEERHSEQSWEGWELVAALGLRVRHIYHQPAVYDHSPTVFGLSSICRPPSMMVVCTYPVVEVKCKCDCFQFPCHFSSHIGIPSSSVDLECATFSCVQIMVWLSLLGIFSTCTDVTACDCNNCNNMRLQASLNWKLILGQTCTSSALDLTLNRLDVLVECQVTAGYNWATFPPCLPFCVWMSQHLESKDEWTTSPQDGRSQAWVLISYRNR